MTSYLKHLKSAVITDSTIVHIDKIHITKYEIEYNRFKYAVHIAPIVIGFSSMITLCGIKISTNYNGVLGFFCEKTDGKGLSQTLFGFPGDFFMGESGKWVEPVYPIPSSLAVTSNLVISFSLEKTCAFPDIEICFCRFKDINNLYPQVFVYKTRKNNEDCAVVSGIYYPQRGFVQKQFLKSQILPTTYKIVPSIRLLGNTWKDDSMYQTEFATLKHLEDTIAEGHLGGDFTVHTDSDKDCTEHDR